MRRISGASAGFTIVDMVFVMMIASILAAIAVPSMQNISNAVVLGEAQRGVASELQQAKLRAVTTNRPMRVRFNCPQNGFYRTVELIGSTNKPSPLDDAANRCQTNAYPSPPADVNPLTLPNHDGPARHLDPRVTFGAVQTIEFWPDGTAHIDSAGGATPWPQIPVAGIAITMTKGTVVKTVTVNGLGKIEAK